MKYPKVMTLCLVAMAVASSIAHAQVKSAAKEFRMLESGGPSGDSIEQSRWYARAHRASASCRPWCSRKT